ncbi:MULTISPECIES: hypothetical protein [Paenibacillus]|uniref:DUF7408 domain-containing protein n=1 Tax=Paenibacillus TaxID=44249 RepID=UPI002FE3C07E
MLSIKRYALYAFLGWMLTAFCVAGIPASAAEAGPKITIQSEEGFGGLFKSNEWIPLKISLTSDQDISGELVVQTAVPFSGTRISRVQQVDLPAGTTKVVTFGIEGDSFSKNNNEIRFYEGSAESGEYIPFASGTPYLQSASVRGTLIGVLAADPDTMNFLAALNGNANQAVIAPLKGSDIPKEAALLGSLDVLVMNNYPADSLTKEQVEAIRSWVDGGGSLVLAGGQGYPKTAKGFEDLSPVEYKGSTDVSSLPNVAKAGGKPLALGEPFPVSEATLKKGAKAEIAEGSLPLFASWSVGKGKVYYAAYDPAMTPLQGWSGHPEVWSGLLREEISANPGSLGQGGMRSGSNPIFNISYLLDYFPSLTLPPFSMLFWLLLGYAVLVAPVLYYVLKKIDKREWAWGLIPLIAVLASGAVYMTGTSGKSSVRSHTLSFVELDGKGRALNATASALFVPRGGTYNVSLPAGTFVSVSREDGLISGGQGGQSNRQLVRVKQDATEVKLRDMTHRSLAKLWLGETVLPEFGAIKIESSYDAQGRLTGKVTNETNTDLNKAAILSAGKVYRIGDLPQGKTVQIPAADVAVYTGDYGSSLYPPTGNKEDYLLERQRGMINYYMDSLSSRGKNTFIGWSEEPLDQGQYEVNGKTPQTDRLNLVAQSFVPEFEQNGEVSIPFGVTEARITEVTAQEWGTEGANRVNMSSGEMTLEYTLPDLGDIRVSRLTVRSTYPGDKTTVSIWNQEVGKWEKFDLGAKFEADLTKKASAYVRSRTVKIKIAAGEWTYFDLPEISLKGKQKR